MNAIIREIMRVVSKDIAISRHRLRVESKKKELVQARQLICLVAGYLKFNDKVIADAIDKDRSTANISIDKMAFLVMTYEVDRKKALKVCIDLDIDQGHFMNYCRSRLIKNKP
jgi:chromosomal replication initiation ATPase DnaA